MVQIIEMPSRPDYTGKTITISPECPTARFQCRGFVVFRNSPAIVPPNADMYAIQNGLFDGRLLELSPGSVIKTKNASLNPVEEIGATEKTLFTLLTKDGPIVLTTEDPEQAAAIEKELQETGQLNLSHFPDLQQQKTSPPYLSGITITDLEPEETNDQSDSC